MSPRVLVLLTNWKRPANLPACIRAWRDQSLPPAAIVVVDNSRPRLTHYAEVSLQGLPVDPLSFNEDKVGCAADSYPNPLLRSADDVWRISNNIGPLCRLWPALALAPRYDYILFADDDFIPGREGLQAAVDSAKSVNDRFATIGQQGRTFSYNIRKDDYLGSGHGCSPDPGEAAWSYKFGDTPRLDDKPRIVDCTVRTHLVLASLLHRVFRLRENMSPQLCDDHDDLTLCLGLQLNPGWPSYVLPISTLSRQLIVENLPGTNGPEACWKRQNHLTDRSRFINLAYEAGWRSFVGGA